MPDPKSRIKKTVKPSPEKSKIGFGEGTPFNKEEQGIIASQEAANAKAPKNIVKKAGKVASRIKKKQPTRFRVD